MSSLRSATRDAHRRTDADIRRADWLSSPRSYADFLTRTWRFQLLVDAAVAPLVPLIDGLEYTAGRRADLLESDLAALASTGVRANISDEPPGASASLLIGDPAEALGCLYVVEGSTLGGWVLAKWIQRRLGYDRTRGASNFAPDHTQDATVRRWQNFGALVERWLASAPTDLDPMLMAASATFAVHHAVVLNEFSDR
jgi:heme oxygenase